jgi:hypothetical protein
MLVGTDGGASYSMEEYAAWAGEAGFGEVRRIGLAGPAAIALAIKQR